MDSGRKGDGIAQITQLSPQLTEDRDMSIVGKYGTQVDHVVSLRPAQLSGSEMHNTLST